jgi:hypothetical protein
MNNEINEIIKGENANNNPNKYNLRSKKKEGKADIPDQPPREENPVKDAANNNKEKKSHNPSSIPKDPVPEVRETLNPPSSFNLSLKFRKSESPYPF